jgi:hypothetical protein
LKSEKLAHKNGITRTIAKFAIKAVRDHQTQNFLKGLKRGQDKYYSCQEFDDLHTLRKKLCKPIPSHLPISQWPMGHQQKVIKSFVGFNQRGPPLLLNAHHVWRS